MSEVFHRKYRPQEYEQVLGQEKTVASLKALKKKGYPNCFLFTGPSGCGKTTLARILARDVGCDPNQIIEVNAATHTGVDDIRNLFKGIRYKAFGDKPNKMFILDECHQLSKSAWNAVLKDIEEPPKHVYFIFCTTEPSKVPKTVRTRAHDYELKEVKRRDIVELLGVVSDEEDLPLDDEALDLIAKESYGSPRQALVYLSKCREAETKEDVGSLLSSAEGSTEVIDFCRYLIDSRNPPTWEKGIKILTSLKEKNPESIRMVTVNYVAVVLAKAKGDQRRMELLSILEAFSEPFRDAEKMAPLLLALGRVTYGMEE